MVYEVEIKAHLEEPARLIKELDEISCRSSEKVHYEDIYLDKAGVLSSDEKELRIRVKEYDSKKEKKVILTYKLPPFDLLSRSKREIEIRISDLQKGIDIMKELGFEPHIRFEKSCRNYFIIFNNYELEITVATITELGSSFIEIESRIEDKNDTDEAFSVIRSFLEKLGISGEKITNQYYTDAVRESRKCSGGDMGLF